MKRRKRKEKNRKIVLNMAFTRRFQQVFSIQIADLQLVVPKQG